MLTTDNQVQELGDQENRESIDAVATANWGADAPRGGKAVMN